ncbi:ankyrin repeat domain-containing protein [uncultured Erythrobacter sp.]|uniref:ankyrin repeat domain-containing protein n=1 Tax=uncultured Erythrobacter sp. TaxID=263913 RepID=UPI00261786BA|nr:ankyrin repeat domain-containing protein [uncultured Erythrobacter sp.]
MAASALAIGAFAVGAIIPLGQPALAQLYSQGYEFLEAVKDRDGDTVTEMLNEPGTTVINTRDITTGESGLHVVVARRDTTWVRFLLQRGANPNIRDNAGLTPLQLATRLGFVEGVEELLKKGAQVTVADSQGETPLMSAVHQRNVELVRRLLAEGADPDRNDNSGRSARDYLALMTGNTLLAREFQLADEAREGQGTQEQYGPSF